MAKPYITTHTVTNPYDDTEAQIIEFAYQRKKDHKHIHGLIQFSEIAEKLYIQVYDTSPDVVLTMGQATDATSPMLKHLDEVRIVIGFT